MSDLIRVNVGCGQFPLADWVNIDADPSMPAEIHAMVPPLPFNAAEVGEVYLGHLLEHLAPADAHVLLVECYRVLAPGGRLGVVVPDTRAIMRRYLDGPPTEIEYPYGRFWQATDLDHVCALFLYSVVQPSRHQWSYDLETLGRALLAAGFEALTPINRYTDPRLGAGQWYQCGFDARKGDA